LNSVPTWVLAVFCLLLIVGAAAAVYQRSTSQSLDQTNYEVIRLHGPDGTRRFSRLTGPPVRSGLGRPHEDRGACTACHLVMTEWGSLVPAIYSSSHRPHESRGLCSNCHTFEVPNEFGAAVSGSR
jgi:hypothetical protein